MKRDTQNGMELASAYVDQIKLFVIVNNAGMKINVDANVNNSLIKEYLIKDLFLIQVNVNANVINLAVLLNIQIIQIVNVEKNQLIHQLKNVQKQNQLT